MKTLIARIKRIYWVQFTLEVIERFGKDNGGLVAAGLAFFLVLAFVPMLLIGIWVIGTLFVNRPQDAVARIQDLLTTQVLPGAAGHEVRDLIQRANVGATIEKITATRGISGLIGLLGLVWASLQIFVNGAVAMNSAWEIREKRNWFKLHLVALELLLCTGLLLVLSLGATAYGSYLAAHIHVPFVMLALTEAGAITISSVMYTLIYKYLPATTVSWRAAFAGGVIAAIGWEIAKKGLATYLLHPNVSLYGNLANLIIFILWVYYSMMILLIGAESSVVYTGHHEGARAVKIKRATLVKPAADTVASDKHNPNARRERTRRPAGGQGRATPRG